MLFKSNKNTSEEKQPEAQETEEEPTEQEDESKEQGKKKALTLPLVIELEHPYNRGKTTVRTLTCEKRPSMKTLRLLTACGDDEAEMITVLFEEMFNLDQPEMDMVDMEDGVNALEVVTGFFPKIKEATGG